MPVLLTALLLALSALLLRTPAEAREGWRPLPWHLMDVWYQYPRPVRFQALRVVLTVEAAPAETDHLFLAALYGHLGSAAFYFGLQTDLHDHRSHRDAGRGILFSRWGPGNEADVRPGAGGWSAILDHARSGEGDFAGVRLPHPWQAGRYEFRLLRRPAEDGRGLWADLLVFDARLGRWLDAGGLRFGEGGDQVQKSAASFLELYGRAPTPRFPEDYRPPALRFQVSAPELAGPELSRPELSGPELPDQVTARIGARMPHWSRARWTGSGVEIELNPGPLAEIPLEVLTTPLRPR
jgi:hypothetical protein